jgi:hypothetical protein
MAMSIFFDHYANEILNGFQVEKWMMGCHGTMRRMDFFSVCSTYCVVHKESLKDMNVACSSNSRHGSREVWAKLWSTRT